MRRLAVLAMSLSALLAPAAAVAHPLGNFTVNSYSGIELAGNRVYVHYVLDLAEIPTFQEGDRVRAPGFAARMARGLDLRIDGRRALLRALEHELHFRPGAGGLKTLRFEAVYLSTRTGRALAFDDRNYEGRIGWREVVVRARDGTTLVDASVPAISESNALRAYPTKLLSSPLDVRSATATYEPGARPGLPPRLSGTAPSVRGQGGFESLVETDLGLGAVLLALLLAAFWGAAHALTPGHGKAIIAGYLVGSRGSPRHAVFLGLIVTLTHTVGVFALGLVTLLLSQFIVPERLYPWLTVASGLLVIAVGASVFRSRLRHRQAHAPLHDHPHEHHPHEHHLHHGEPGVRGLLGVGVAAGILPCPSALVVLLSAIALHRIGLGLALIFAFSVGLAATITSIGLLAVFARGAFSRLRFDGPLVGALPSVSALLILAVGIGLTVKALPGVF
jgi:nickel/cobalt transporter (NicO) family protein